MISVQKLTKTFGRLTVLDNVSVELQAGLAISLIGPNGSGKTTFIKSLLGLVIPNQGDIRVQGQLCRDNWTYRDQIGYMPQISRYPENLTIRQLIRMMTDLRKKHAAELDTDLIDAFGLPTLYDKTMRSLSGGTRQKVGACLAFLFNPPIIILDEPTAGLDPLASEILKAKLLREKQDGKLILITSHILSDLDGLTTDVMYMQEGRLQFLKPVAWLQQQTGETKLNRAIARLMENPSLIDDAQASKPNFTLF
ncbi:ABC transporter ATP-binding protein [uncultured Spirosoma sp.]|uniref:ABC transporter ATP-binding protein n=2 Tax=Spirosoma TaxID=107 RepID=UPI00261F3184|nr:ABC transporter ATP-binding protein [uncultured Spirosoma sp.]